MAGGAGTGGGWNPGSAAWQAMGIQGIGGGPVGGIIGFLLFGNKKEEEFEAAGARAARMFAQIGDVGQATISRLHGMTKAYWMQWGMGLEELQGVTSAFARFGITGDEVTKRLGVSIKGFGADVLGTSFAMDTLFNAPTGTFATAIGQAAEASGQSLEATTAQVLELGMSLRNTGVNAVEFVGQLSQMASAARMQGETVGDLGEMYQKLNTSLGQAGGPMAGANAHALGRASLEGVRALSQGLGNLPEGLAGFMGTKILGNQVSPAEAIIRTREGLGSEGHFDTRMVKELGSYLTQTFGPDRYQKQFALEKIAPSLGSEGARALVLISDKMETDLKSGKSLDEVLKKYQKDLDKAMADKSKEEPAYLRALRKLQVDLLNISTNILNVLVALAVKLDPDNLIGSVKAAFPGLRETITDDERHAMNMSKKATEVIMGDKGLGGMDLGSILKHMGEFGQGSQAVDTLKQLLQAYHAPLETAETRLDRAANVARWKAEAEEERNRPGHTPVTSMPDKVELDKMLEETAKRFESPFGTLVGYISKSVDEYKKLNPHGQTVPENLRWTRDPKLGPLHQAAPKPTQRVGPTSINYPNAEFDGVGELQGGTVQMLRGTIRLLPRGSTLSEPIVR